MDQLARSLRYLSIVWMCCRALVCPLTAQEEILYFDHLSTQNGLTGNTFNYFVRKDSRGIIWISSFNGLIRYDGTECTPFLPDERDTLSISDSNVQSPLFEDRQGRLWFNTSNCIHYYDTQLDEVHRVPVYYEKGKTYSDFQLIFFDTLENNLWFLTEKGILGDYFPLYTMNVDQPNELHFVDSIPNHLVEGLQIIAEPVSQSQYLLIPQTSGWEVRHYRKGKRVPTSSSVQHKQSGANCFYYDSRKSLWVGTTAGLIKTDLQGKDQQPAGDFFGKPITNIRGIIPYDPDHLLIATEDMGLYLFDLFQFRYTHQISTIQGGFVRPFQLPIWNMHLDQDQNLWIATKAQGIYYTNLNKKRFNSHLQKRLESPQNYNVKSLTQDSRGRIWCLTDQGIVITDKRGTILPVTDTIRAGNAMLRDMDTYYIVEDSRQNIWVCTSNGIFVLPPGKKEFIPAARGRYKERPAPVITYVYELNNHTLLASSYGEGLFEIEFSDGQPKLWPAKSPLDASGAFMVLYEDSQENLYASQIKEGIRVYKKEENSLVDHARISFPPMVNAMAESPDSSRIWIGSSLGLYWLEKGTDSLDLQKDSIFSAQYPNINGLLFDDNEQLWISTSKGLVLYDPGKRSDDSKEIPYDFYRTFDIDDGLQGSDFNFWSFLKTQDGQLVFGGVNGFSIFNPNNVPPYPIIARPIIKRITINGHPLENSSNASFSRTGDGGEYQLELGPAVSTFRLDFLSLEYGQTDLDRFLYKLKRPDGTIISSGLENYVSFANLQPGKYEFELFASNTENVWNTQPLHLSLRIKPPFFKRTEFYVFLFLLFAGTVLLIYRNRLAHIRKKQHLAELETAILRVQMNPHFIFNSLDSILAYVREKDLHTADTYLMHLAKLMRKILDSADRPYLSIYEERQLLEEYMKVEVLRFEHAFSYRFEIADDLDIDEVVIPTMLLQPFVENAIIHGFRGQKKNGLITVSFRTSEQQLHCVVEDNGRGRQATKRKGHTSKALEITQKRLKLIEEQTKKPTEFSITDLTDEEGQAIGTRVKLTIPLL